MDRADYGTELKYRLNIETSGFSMESNDFSVVLTCGDNIITLNKGGQGIVHEGNDWYICFSTLDTGKGVVQASVSAFVPDAHFPDGLRTEVFKTDLVKVE